jgi:hypothetical protein
MAKSKRRIQAAARKRSRKEAWKLMTPEARKEWSEKRAKTAKTGYAARTRERANGKPMSSRTHETPAWHSPIWRTPVVGRETLMGADRMEREAE